MKTRKAGLAVFLCLAMVLPQAFSCATAIKELEAWSPTVLNAFAGVVALVNPQAGSALAIAGAEIPKVWGVVQAAISNYQANPTTGTLNEVTAALNAANSQFNAFLAAIQQNPNSNEAKAAEAGMLLLVTTLESIQARLATVAPATQNAHMARAVTLGVSPAKNNADFKKRWNVIMTANGHPERVLR